VVDHELTEEERAAERKRERRALERHQSRAIARMFLVPAACALALGSVWGYLSSSMDVALVIASILVSVGNVIATTIVTDWG
jgi:hypothetical protein